MCGSPTVVRPVKCRDCSSNANNFLTQLRHPVSPSPKIYPFPSSCMSSLSGISFDITSICGTNERGRRSGAQGHPPVQPRHLAYTLVSVYIPVTAATALAPASAPAPPAEPPMCGPPSTPHVCSWTTRGTGCSSTAWIVNGADSTRAN